MFDLDSEITKLVNHKTPLEEFPTNLLLDMQININDILANRKVESKLKWIKRDP
jgi:hypothetical protein